MKKKAEGDDIPKLYLTNVTVLGEIYLNSNIEMLVPTPDAVKDNDYS